MKKIKTGLASFGMSGQIFHAPFISIHPGFELTAITERSKELSKERYPAAQIVRSVEELVNIKDLELVVINTPDSTHYEYARLALNAGKHVIVEKPFTTTVEQGEELTALARKKGLMLSIYQNRRWDSDFLTVKEVIRKGLTGRLVEFESTFPRFRNFVKPGTWKETGKQGGGITYNLGAHLIDQAIQLFGMPEALFADIDILRDGGMVDDYFIIHLLRCQKAPDIKITLKSSYLMCELEPRFVLHGTSGSFVKYGLDRQEADLTAGLMPDTPHWGEEDEAIWGTLHTQIDGVDTRYKYPSLKGNYAGFYTNIYEYLRNNQPLEVKPEDVLNVIRLIEAAHLSSREKRVIALR